VATVEFNWIVEVRSKDVVVGVAAVRGDVRRRIRSQDRVQQEGTRATWDVLLPVKAAPAPEAIDVTFKEGSVAGQHRSEPVPVALTNSESPTEHRTGPGAAPALPVDEFSRCVCPSHRIQVRMG